MHIFGPAETQGNILFSCISRRKNPQELSMSAYYTATIMNRHSGSHYHGRGGGLKDLQMDTMISDHLKWEIRKI